MRLNLIFLCLLICVMASACKESRSDSAAATTGPTQVTAATTPASKPPRVIGKLVPMEPVAGTADATYAYYLPQTYNVEQPIPVVVFLDAHAQGKDPVGLYQGLAEQFDMLLVGSNASKNGQQAAQGLAIYDALMTDLKLKFAIDERQVTLAGFSGGARVAANIAQNRPAISSVIACAAGFEPRPGDKFNYYAIVGKKDFNYQELRLLEGMLDDTPQRHVMDYWDGGHEWPAAAVMQDALAFVRMRGMTVGAMGLDTLVSRARTRLAAQANASALLHARAYKALIARLDGLTDVSQERQELEKLQASPGYADELATENKTMEEEMALRSEYVPQIGTKNINEWRGIVGKLSPTKWPSSSSAYFLRHRVLNFLSLNTYFQVDGALKAGDLPTAEHFLEIYKLVDPTNSEAPYLTAVLRMRQNQPAAAIDALQAAQRLGFKDADRMAADPDFAGLRSDAKFVQVLETIRSL
jgi:predicted esterase